MADRDALALDGHDAAMMDENSAEEMGAIGVMEITVEKMFFH